MLDEHELEYLAHTARLRLVSQSQKMKLIVCEHLRVTHTVYFFLLETTICFLLIIGYVGVGDFVTVTSCEQFHWVLYNLFCCDKKNRSHNQKKIVQCEQALTQDPKQPTRCDR